MFQLKSSLSHHATPGTQFFWTKGRRKTIFPSGTMDQAHSPTPGSGALSEGTNPAGLLTRGSSHRAGLPGFLQWRDQPCSPLTVAGAVAELARYAPHCIPSCLRGGPRNRTCQGPCQKCAQLVNRRCTWWGTLPVCLHGGTGGVQMTSTRRLSSPSTDSSITSPRRTGPTPAGVPDRITSPGASSK